MPSGRIGISIQLEGKRYHVSGDTRTKAREARDALLARHRAGLLGDPLAQRQTTATYLRAWLRGKRPTIVASTWERYRICVDVHLVPLFGNVPLGQLSALRIREGYARLSAQGQAPRSVRYVHVTLHQALRQAVADGMLARAPTSGVKPPKVEREEMVPLSAAQVRRLLDVAEGHWRTLWMLALYTGMRSGELLGLLWRDVDLARGRLIVQRAQVYSEQGPVRRDEPKRKSSIRQLSLAPEVVASLRAHQHAQRLARLAAPYWLDTAGAVFVRPTTGARFFGSELTRQLRRDAQRAEIEPPPCVHDLRHTAASHWLAAGRPLTEVSRLLGHSSPAITLAIYAHALPGIGDDAATALARAYREA